MTNSIWTISKSKWKSSKDESKSKGMHEDLQKKEIFQVKKQASTFLQIGNLELHEVRQRTATIQCPQCSAYFEEGFQFCKCGAGLQMAESTISRIRKRFQELLGSSYYIPVKKNRDKKHGDPQWQVHHSKAKDTLRNVLKDRKYNHLHPGNTVDGQDITNGLGGTMTGESTNGDLSKTSKV